MKAKTTALLTLGGLIFLVITMALAPPAFAVTNWNVSSGDWSTGSNWDAGEPNYTTDAKIQYGGTATASITQSGEQAKSLVVGTNVGTGTVTMNSGSLTVATDLIVGNNNGSTGLYNLNGGSVSAGTVYAGNYGNGTITQTGGSMAATNALYVANAATSTSVYNLQNAGSSLNTATEYIGMFGNGTFNQSNGTNTVTNLHVGENNGSVGIYNQDGGTNTVSILDLAGYSGSNGTYNLNGGTLNAGRITNNAGTGGTLKINGGTLNLTGSGASSVATFTFDSGILNMNGSGTFTNSIANGSGTSTININTTTGALSGSSLAADNFNVGKTAQGAFTLDNGKTLTTNIMSVGQDAAATSQMTQYGNVSVGSDLLLRNSLYKLKGGTLSVVGDIKSNDQNSSWYTSKMYIDGGTLSVTGSNIGIDNLYVGQEAQGAFILANGKTLTSVNTYVGTFQGADSTMTQNANVGLTGDLYIGRGIYNLNGGTLTTTNVVNNTGAGTLTVAGGTLTASGTIAADTLNFNSGAMNYSTMNVGTANINHALDVTAGQTLSAQTNLHVGNGASLNIAGGAVNGTGTAIVDAGSSIQGYGTTGMTGVLTVNGKIIADGSGSERTLDLSSFSSIVNTVTNTGANGLYAINKGKLELAPIYVAKNSETSTYVWGSDLSLINSVQFEFHNVTVDDWLQVTLMDPTRDDIPGNPTFGLLDYWNFDRVDDTLLFDYVDITIHYDASKNPAYWGQEHEGVWTTADVRNLDTANSLVTLRYTHFSGAGPSTETPPPGVPELPTGLLIPVGLILMGALLWIRRLQAVRHK